MLKITNLFRHYWGTTVHKFWVMYFLILFCINLLWRGIVHDLSKYSWAETKGFIQVIHRLKHTTYGSDEYKENLRKIRPSIEHHNFHNTHHPEHYPNGIDNFNLHDLVEMWCDWNAAVKRHKDGDVYKSIEHNKDRFGISEQLENILKSTRLYQFYKWIA